MPAPVTEKPAAKAEAVSAKNLSCFKPAEPGYALVVSGTLQEDLELGPEQSPVLFRGAVIIPENIKLTLRGGAVVHLKADSAAKKAGEGSPSGSPDPTQCAVVWVFGTLATQGVTGNPVELLNQEKCDASLLFYGAHESAIEGARLKGISFAQNGGTTLWINCEILGGGTYAMACGAAVVTQCTFRKFGGIFATYDAGPWSLLLRKNLFDSCREGLILGSDPGETRLIVEKNHFINTQGAHIRAMPRGDRGRKSAPADARASKSPGLELLIGENWYGSAIPEEVDMRIVDSRVDSNIHARLNTRPPAGQPYANVGAGVSAQTLQTTLKEQQAVQQRLLQSQLALKKPGEKLAQQIKRD